MELVTGTNDIKEGMRAFAEKRDPNFTDTQRAVTSSGQRFENVSETVFAEILGAHVSALPGPNSETTTMRGQ